MFSLRSVCWNTLLCDTSPIHLMLLVGLDYIRRPCVMINLHRKACASALQGAHLVTQASEPVLMMK